MSNEKKSKKRFLVVLFRRSWHSSMGSAEPINFQSWVLETIIFEMFHWNWTYFDTWKTTIGNLHLSKSFWTYLIWIPSDAPGLSNLPCQVRKRVQKECFLVVLVKSLHTTACLNFTLFAWISSFNHRPWFEVITLSNRNIVMWGISITCT